MAASRLCYAGILDTATRLRSGELSPLELTDHLLERIATLDRLAAFTTITADTARQAARRAGEELARGKDRGPLHGIPVAVKDLCFTAGIPTLGGSGSLRGHVPAFSATVVRRLLEAGAVLLGKLATTEGAKVGYHPDFAVPRNPWGEDRWPGVSSSGSGVATAAGLCCAALGTDTGGSIRYPSAANGVVGLKPTWGRVSRHGVLDLAPSMDHVGPLARRVADAAAVLEVIAGHDPEDATSRPDVPPRILATLDEGIGGLRVGFDEEYAGAGVPPHVEAAIHEALNVLKGLGARIVEVRMPQIGFDQLQAWNVICAAEAIVAHRDRYPAKGDLYGPWFGGWLEFARQLSGAEYARAHAIRLELSGRIACAFQHIDALLCPSVLSEAISYDPGQAYAPFDAGGDSVAGVPIAWFSGSGPFTIPYDFNGYPTLSLPCGASPDGLPLSLQLVGHPLSEALLCRLGHAFEQATEWHLRHPPL